MADDFWREAVALKRYWSHPTKLIGDQPRDIRVIVTLPDGNSSELAATVLEGEAVVHGSLKSIMLSSRLSAGATVRYRSSQRTSAEIAQKFEKPMKLSMLLLISPI